MSEIYLTATAGPDGVLRLEIPVGAPGEYDVWIRPKPKLTPEELGWPPGYFELTYGSITDEAFKRYPPSSPKPIEPLDRE